VPVEGKREEASESPRVGGVVVVVVEVDVVVVVGVETVVVVEAAVVVEVDVVGSLSAVTVAVAGEVATAEPFLLVAVTTTRSVEPTSVAAGM